MHGEDGRADKPNAVHRTSTRTVPAVRLPRALPRRRHGRRVATSLLIIDNILHDDPPMASQQHPPVGLVR
jgi:hypothetical protein